MLRPILIHPDPRLKKVCDPVSAVDDGVRKLVSDMFDTMYDAPGIGLAAPQIGINARVLVMDCAKRDDGSDANPVCMINPEVVWASDEPATYEEGCLSIPDVYADVSRPSAVTVRFLNQEGTLQEGNFDGIWSTCVQHEIDHLDGKLFIDYLSAVRRSMITSKMKKLKRDRARS